ncbi:DUF4123 domain-containing protein [Mesorhizobium retamae]|uniref:DUF4123 domain-containing protein n=1 Tax=Mesorhizobium retamae TaxID=2912854 RepID=A0ABS9QN04_9HYPH|nr:DUF4123 domain-containing protein [Mesorhizobium sp. IRAMC:0171]
MAVGTEFEGESLSPAAAKLAKAAEKMSGPLFAAVDGAQYGHLPRLLKSLGLDHRSLFLEHGDEKIEAASGWLVPIPDQPALLALLAHSEPDCGSLVLWACPAGEAALHRHLRSINLVQLPKSTIPQDEESSPEEEGATEPDGTSDYESVLFRHYDPNVLASLLPIMTEGQFARILGPATQVLFHAEDYGGLRSAEHPGQMVIRPKGMLRIDAEQIEELEEVRHEASNRKIADYLREVAPDNAGQMDEERMASFVAENRRSAQDMGIRSELATGYWAYLNLGSEGRVAALPTTRDYLRNHPEDGTADEKIFALMHRLSKPASGETA